MYRSNLMSKRSGQIVRVVATALATQLMSGRIASAQRPTVISSMDYYNDGSDIMLEMVWDPTVVESNDFAAEVWQADDNTIDDDAQNITGSSDPDFIDSGGSCTLTSYYSDHNTTFEFFVGTPDGPHSAWYGLSIGS